MKLPYQINWQKEQWAVILIIINFLASIYFFSNFPDSVPVHWNLAGQPDGWSNKTFAAFFFPGLILFLYLLLLYLPLFDPFKKRYEEFSTAYQSIRLSLVTLFTLLYLASSYNGLGYNVPIAKIVPLSIGLLFMVIGNLLPKVKKNWFVGIRTPWTLANEEIWNKTHRLGGKIFFLSGLLMILGILFDPKIYIWIFGLTIFLTVFFTMGYSWWLWHKINKT